MYEEINHTYILTQRQQTEAQMVFENNYVSYHFEEQPSKGMNTNLL